MSQCLTFLHAADLHLGAPFRGLRSLSEKWANRMLEAVPEAYARVIDTAIDHDVDFVVFAGDIFDTASPSYADYATFVDGVKRLLAAGIPVYLCAGNHDPYTSWRSDFGTLPEGAHMMSATGPDYVLHERADRPSCVIAGRSYFNQAWPKSELITEGLTRKEANRALGPDAEAAPFGIGLIHTGLKIDLRNAPTEPSTLYAAGFDYWALGHLHDKLVDSPTAPRYGYPGCIQGRDILETGERGVYLVTLREGSSAQVSFVPTASVAWQTPIVDVSTCATLSQVVDEVLRALFAENSHAKCAEMCVRVTLRGATPLHASLAAPGALEDLRQTLNRSYDEFFIDALIDQTSAPLDKAALREEGMFAAALLSASEDVRAKPAELRQQIEQSLVERGVPVPVPRRFDMDAILSRAEDAALDALMREEGR